MPQSFASLHVHLVFSTKHRLPQIKSEAQPRLFEFIGGIVRNHTSSLIATGGMPDHMHLLVSLRRTLPVADLVRIIKSNSSGWAKDELALQDFQWQSGYGAFAVSFSQIDQVKSYLASQQQHHQKKSFQEEFREILKLHELQSDERYVWD